VALPVATPELLATKLAVNGSVTPSRGKNRCAPRLRRRGVVGISSTTAALAVVMVVKATIASTVHMTRLNVPSVMAAAAQIRVEVSLKWQ